MDNYEQVKRAMAGMHDRSLFNLSYSRITLSTVGIVDKMKRFSVDFPKANLAISLHAPPQAIRKQIVPSSARFTVEKIINALQFHIKMTQNKVFIEYICIGNVNVSPTNARDLSKLFIASKIEKKICVNLIPYNRTEIGTQHKFEPPTDRQLEQFKQIVIENGIFCTIRKSTTSGRDVDGACGQLVLRGNDIEDIIPQNIKKKQAKLKAKTKKIKMKEKRKKIEQQQQKALNVKKAMVISTGILALTIASYFTYSNNQRTNIKKKVSPI